MKKFTILFLALSMAFAASAVPVKTAKYALANAGAKQETQKAKALAEKQAPAQTAKVASYVAQKKALAAPSAKKLTKKALAPQPSSKKMPAASQAADTVKIVGEQFIYEYYAESGDWYVGISDNVNYVVYLDYLSTSFAGTFTTEDFDLTYSYMYDYTSGSKVAVTYNAVKMTVTDNETGKDVYAVIDGNDGKVYVVTAHEDPLPEPKSTITLTYANSILEIGNSSFQIQGKDKFDEVSANDSIYTNIILFYEDDITGTYTINDVATMFGASVAYFGADTTWVDPLDFNATVVEDAENNKYICNAELLGTDTILYKITLTADAPAPIVPKDTVDVVITNLSVLDLTEWMSSAIVEGYNAEYDVFLPYDADEVYGTFYGKDLWESAYIAHGVDTMSILDAEIEVANWFGADRVTGKILGSDTILYMLDMSYVVPDAKDTVKIVFETPGEGTYFEAYGDCQIFNTNTQYEVALDIVGLTVDGVGEFAAEDFDSEYTYIYLFNGTDTTGVGVLDAKATVTKVSDGLYSVYAEVLGSDTILYAITSQFTYVTVSAPAGLQYDEETEAANKAYTPADKVTFNTDNLDTYGVVYLDIEAADGSDWLGLGFVVESADEDIVIPAGTYTIGDSYETGSVVASSGYSEEDGVYYSFYATIDGQYFDKLWFLVGGTVKVEKIDGKMKVTVDAVNSYDVPVHIVYDATATAVETPAADAAKVTKKLGADGQLYILHNGKTFTATGVVVE